MNNENETLPVWLLQSDADYKKLGLSKEKVEKWIKNGAKPTETVKHLIEM